VSLQDGGPVVRRNPILSSSLTLMTKALFLLVGCVCALGMASAHMGIEGSEWQTRREKAMALAPDGIILLHSESAPKAWSESGFQQDPNFFYLTGLENLHGAILALDGRTKESWLFVNVPSLKDQQRYADLQDWDAAYLVPGHQLEQSLGIDHIIAWEQFAGFIEERRRTNPKLVLYLDDGGPSKMQPSVSNPPEFAAIENPYLLWSAAISAKWPDAVIGNATPLLVQLRSIKSSAEITLMRKAAAYTDAGFRSAMVAIAPGRSNRQVEGAAIAGALLAGAESPSMWPILKTGDQPRSLALKLNDYHGRNRTMQAGETVRVDLGFDAEVYKGDVGRTVPVSGRFSREQGEIIDLMNGAYQAGLRALHDGIGTGAVIQACTSYVEDHKQSIQSELGKRAIAELLKASTWVMYTHGLDVLEIVGPSVLHAGNTLAFGPDFDIDGQGFYEEDVALITADGYQLINPPLPYTAADIEKTMADLKRSQRN
jgi:Xaa-Pro aminopeptidase